MENDSRETGADMAALAAHAALALSPERAAAAAAILAAWMPAAHELNRKMSAPEHRSLMPATVFAHAPDGTGDARGLPEAPASTGDRP